MKVAFSIGCLLYKCTNVHTALGDADRAQKRPSLRAEAKSGRQTLVKDERQLLLAKTHSNALPLLLGALLSELRVQNMSRCGATEGINMGYGDRESNLAAWK